MRLLKEIFNKIVKAYKTSSILRWTTLLVVFVAVELAILVPHFSNTESLSSSSATSVGSIMDSRDEISSTDSSPIILDSNSLEQSSSSESSESSSEEESSSESSESSSEEESSSESSESSSEESSSFDSSDSSSEESNSSESSDSSSEEGSSAESSDSSLEEESSSESSDSSSEEESSSESSDSSSEEESGSESSDSSSEESNSSENSSEEVSSSESPDSSSEESSSSDSSDSSSEEESSSDSSDSSSEEESSSENSDSSSEEESSSDSLESSSEEEKQDSPPEPSATYTLEFESDVNEEYYICTGISESDATPSHIVIPDEYEGLEVREIAANAFAQKYWLYSVTIGRNIQEIGSNAFYDCPNLFEVYNLSDLSINAGKTDNGQVAYRAKCVHSSTSEVSILRRIGDFVTYSEGADTILIGYVGTDTSVEIPDTITVINSNAFAMASQTEKIVLSDSVTKICTKAFSYCENLTEVTLGTGVRVIESYAFSATKLQKLYFPDSLTSDWILGEANILSPSDAEILRTNPQETANRFLTMDDWRNKTWMHA